MGRLDYGPWETFTEETLKDFLREGEILISQEEKEEYPRKGVLGKV